MGKPAVIFRACAVIILIASAFPAAAEEQTNKDAYWASLRDRCRQYGFAVGTDAFAQCMQNEDRRSQAQAEIDKEAERKREAKSWCVLGHPGNPEVCDEDAPKKRMTYCSRDLLGRVSCVTQ